MKKSCKYGVSVSGFIQPTVVYSFPINGRVVRRAQCPYVPSSLFRASTKHHSFQLGFYSNSCFTSAGELIQRLNS